MKSLVLTIAALATGYFLWSCKVRIAETSGVAASETMLAGKEAVACSSETNEYPRFSGVTLDREQAALRFTLENKGATGSAFTFVYFTHATKYYDPKKDVQYYAVRLGDNLVDFAARGGNVEKIYYKTAGEAIELACQ